MPHIRHDRPVVLITGAAKRVGAVIARRLHAAGHDLALHYRRSRDDVDMLAAELEQARPGSTLCLQAELAELDRLPSLVQDTLSRFGRLDALINNASAFYKTPIGGVTSAQWNDLFASNAQAPFFLAQAATPALRQTQGCIVNLVDIYAERPLAEHAVYCMAKAALEAMTRSLALDLGPDIRVNAIAPGAVMWPSDGKAYDDQQAMIERTPLKRAGHPQDIASAVLWLLQGAPFVTGQVLRIDGGRTLSV